jgi:hypothetical protein
MHTDAHRSTGTATSSRGGGATLGEIHFLTQQDVEKKKQFMRLKNRNMHADKAAAAVLKQLAALSSDVPICASRPFAVPVLIRRQTLSIWKPRPSTSCVARLVGMPRTARHTSEVGDVRVPLNELIWRSRRLHAGCETAGAAESERCNQATGSRAGATRLPLFLAH